MKEHGFTSEAAEVNEATTTAAAEIAAATVKLTRAASEIAAATANFTAAAAADMAAFYTDCTNHVIKLCDDKRKEVQSDLSSAIDMASKGSKNSDNLGV